MSFEIGSNSGDAINNSECIEAEPVEEPSDMEEDGMRHGMGCYDAKLCK